MKGDYWSFYAELAYVQGVADGRRDDWDDCYERNGTTEKDRAYRDGYVDGQHLRCAEARYTQHRRAHRRRDLARRNAAPPAGG
jgi:hypothetical protein